MDRAPARAQPRKAICAGLDPEGPGQMSSYGPSSPLLFLTFESWFFPYISVIFSTSSSLHFFKAALTQLLS